jgi:DNA polymerase-3 subunit delta
VAKSSASDAVSAIDWLGESKPGPLPPVCALFGDEPFLKRLAIHELRRRAAEGNDEAEFSVLQLDGDTAQPRDVFDALSTHSLFGGGRTLVIIEEADKFVSDNRERLEDYVAKPSSAGVLALEVSTWPSNTRLFKAVASQGLNLSCSSPTGAGLSKWLVTWAKSHHQAKLQTDAAETLVDYVGPELGLLDQELAKLASAAKGEPITCELVERYVGTWRTKTAWEMIDAVVDGNAASAMKQLDRLLAAGEHPIALLAQISSTLRRFAAATQLLEESERKGRRTNTAQLLEQAGFKPFVIKKAESQWRQLGRKRTERLYQVLLETDLALKGRASQAARARLVLEQLIVGFSQTADPRRAAAN